MNIAEISREEYKSLSVNRDRLLFNRDDFIELNKAKADEIYYIRYFDKHNFFVLTAGVRNNGLYLPFSAPFSCFTPLREHIRIEDIDEALEATEVYAKLKGFKNIWFRLPPSIYNPDYISKLENCFLRKGYLIEECDLNYSIRLHGIDEYLKSLRKNAQKNLKKGLDAGFIFIKCEDEDSKKKAYEVIEKNRKEKGYPLRMTWEEVYITSKLAEGDFFLLKSNDDDVAAAIIFRINSKLRQVIYWGDIHGFEEKRPMNVLSYSIVGYYIDQGIIEELDIGPSTENGIPNYGLCDFKESIGCRVSTKYTFVKELL